MLFSDRSYFPFLRLFLNYFSCLNFIFSYLCSLLYVGVYASLCACTHVCINACGPQHQQVRICIHGRLRVHIHVLYEGIRASWGRTRLYAKEENSSQGHLRRPSLSSTFQGRSSRHSKRLSSPESMELSVPLLFIDSARAQLPLHINCTGYISHPLPQHSNTAANSPW